MATKTQTPETNAATAKCACKCGATNNKGRIFRPGHDARMVSLLVRDVTSGALSYTKAALDLDLTKTTDHQSMIDEVVATVEDRFSTALADKTAGALHRAWAISSKTSKAKPAPKAAKEIEKVLETKPVKIGRWTYPTRVVDGVVFRNTKTNGSAEWVVPDGE